MNKPTTFASRLAPTDPHPSAADPRPPFQVRGVETVYLESKMDSHHTHTLLPA